MILLEVVYICSSFWLLLLHHMIYLKLFNIAASTTVIQNAWSHLEIGFDIWLLETSQLCLIFISKGQFLLKKIIQGHKYQKGQWRPKKVIQGQNFKKSLISSIFNDKIINKWECNTKKKLFFKNWKFQFHNIKFLILQFVKNIKIAGFCW